MNSLSVLILIVFFLAMGTEKVALRLLKRLKLVPDLGKESHETVEMNNLQMENIGAENIQFSSEYHSLTTDIYEVQSEAMKCKILFLNSYHMLVKEYLSTFSDSLSFDLSKNEERDKFFLPKYPRLDCPLFITLRILHALDTVKMCPEVALDVLKRLSKSLDLNVGLSTLGFFRKSFKAKRNSTTN